MKKLIRYRIPVSIVFPATHKRKGDQTFFIQKIKQSLGLFEFHRPENVNAKIHTIRANYTLWAKRFEKILRGEAVLELYYWSGKPYNSKCVTICQLGKDDGIGIQKLINRDGSFFFNDDNSTIFSGLRKEELAKNDGLSFEDFKEWFRNYDLSKPMVIIHFTSFRY